MTVKSWCLQYTESIWTTHTLLPSYCSHPTLQCTGNSFLFYPAFLFMVRQEHFNGHNTGTYYIKSKFLYCNRFPLFTMRIQVCCTRHSLLRHLKIKNIYKGLSTFHKFIPQHLRERTWHEKQPRRAPSIRMQLQERHPSVWGIGPHGPEVTESTWLL